MYAPKTAKCSGRAPRRPGARSAKSTVPDAVPSVFHSSAPCSGSVAWKNVNGAVSALWNLRGADGLSAERAR